MLPRKYSGCHLIYFSIIKDIKPAARGPTLSVFFFLFSFLFAGLGAPSRLSSLSLSFLPRPLSLLLFFPRLATAINQKKRFKPPVWSGVGTQFSVCQEIKI